jgi:hypothetical protein
MDAQVSRRSGVGRWWWAIGLVIAAVIAILASYFASGDPDGLERVAEDQGFLDRAEDAFYQILPDYTIPGVEGPVGTAFAGIIGILVVFGVMWLIGRVVARRRLNARS